ncbi:MAG: hypothetical protein ACK55I_50675, partial [bacterium]
MRLRPQGHRRRIADSKAKLVRRCPARGDRGSGLRELAFERGINGGDCGVVGQVACHAGFGLPGVGSLDVAREVGVAPDDGPAAVFDVQG